MNSNGAFSFLKEYFEVLFIERDLDKISNYLHPDYWDDDIGNSEVNHIENGKQYLQQLFERKPKVGVKVINANIHNNVISAHLEWYNDISDPKSIWLKGIGLFVMESGKILKRHTFIYSKSE